MAVSYGFYNSLNGDRKYDAIQHGSIFDGIVKDGVFMSIGGYFFASPGNGMTINIAEGRAWFNHTWLLNDSILPVTIDQSEIVLKRIDKIVIDVNAIQNVRANSIMYIKGTPSANPVAPILINETDHHQYPICDIYVNAGVTSFNQANLTNHVGTSQTPFVTGILQTINIDNLISQWGQQWTNFFNAETGEMTATKEQWQDAWNSWYTTQTTAGEQDWDEWYTSQTEGNEQQWDTWYQNETSTDEAAIQAWQDQRQADFDVWFQSMQGSLGTEPATNLQNQVNLHSRAFAQIFTTGIIKTTEEEPFIISRAPGTDLAIQVGGGDFIFNGFLDTPPSVSKCFMFSQPGVTDPIPVSLPATMRYDNVVISVNKSASNVATAIIKIVEGTTTAPPALSTTDADYQYLLATVKIYSSAAVDFNISQRIYAESLIGLNPSTIIGIPQGGTGKATAVEAAKALFDGTFGINNQDYAVASFANVGDTGTQDSGRMSMRILRASLGLGSMDGTGALPPLGMPYGGTGASNVATVVTNIFGSNTEIGSPPARLVGVSSSGAPLNRSIQDVRNAMGLGNTLSAVPVVNGGTGADNAGTARLNIGAAAASHSHNASDINAGTLGLARGGLGVALTKNPSMLVNLGSTGAANVFQNDPRPGVTGILSTLNGGTGQNAININTFTQLDHIVNAPLTSGPPQRIAGYANGVWGYFTRSIPMVFGTVSPIFIPSFNLASSNYVLTDSFGLLIEPSPFTYVNLCFCCLWIGNTQFTIGDNTIELGGYSIPGGGILEDVQIFNISSSAWLSRADSVSIMLPKTAISSGAFRIYVHALNTAIGSFNTYWTMVVKYRAPI